MTAHYSADRQLQEFFKDAYVKLSLEQRKALAADLTWLVDKEGFHPAAAAKELSKRITPTPLAAYADALLHGAKRDRHPSRATGILCPMHGAQGLDATEYHRQLSDPDSTWSCPIYGCTERVVWDDDRYER